MHKKIYSIYLAFYIELKYIFSVKFANSYNNAVFVIITGLELWRNTFTQLHTSRKPKIPAEIAYLYYLLLFNCKEIITKIWNVKERMFFGYLRTDHRYCCILELYNVHPKHHNPLNNRCIILFYNRARLNNL